MRLPVTLALLTACATTSTRPQPVGSRGLHANEHMQAAAQQDELAASENRWPRTEPDANGRIDQPIGVPWRLSWQSAADHARLAAAHRSSAAELQADFERACGERPLADVSVSPLQRYGLSGSPIASGVELLLAPAAGPPQHLLADIRCHRAWMMLAPADMETCPLDLDGIRVEATGDANGVTVTITADDPRVVPELQRRAAHELEVAAGHAP